jgi:hypothetical protein
MSDLGSSSKSPSAADDGDDVELDPMSDMARDITRLLAALKNLKREEEEVSPRSLGWFMRRL